MNLREGNEKHLNGRSPDSSCNAMWCVWIILLHNHLWKSEIKMFLFLAWGKMIQAFRVRKLLSMGSLLMERIFLSTPNEVRWHILSGCQVMWPRHFSTTCAVQIEDCEGWWLSVCHSSVAEHWHGVLNSIPGEYQSFQFPLFHFITSKISLCGGSLVKYCVADWRKLSLQIMCLVLLLCVSHTFRCSCQCT